MAHEESRQERLAHEKNQRWKFWLKGYGQCITEMLLGWHSFAIEKLSAIDGGRRRVGAADQGSMRRKMLGNEARRSVWLC